MMQTESTADVADDLADDLAALEDAPRYKPGPPCGVATILRRLAQERPLSYEKLAPLLDNDSVSATKIAERLSTRGFPVAAQSVSRHRRRGQHNGCRCPR